MVPRKTWKSFFHLPLGKTLDHISRNVWERAIHHCLYQAWRTLWQHHVHSTLSIWRKEQIHWSQYYHCDHDRQPENWIFKVVRFRVPRYSHGIDMARNFQPFSSSACLERRGTCHSNIVQPLCCCIYYRSNPKWLPRFPKNFKLLSSSLDNREIHL